MRRNLFLIVLTFIAIFGYSPQGFTSSRFADEIPLLTGQSKTQTFVNSSGDPDIALGPNIDKYIKYCSDHNLSCDLIETLWKLEQCKYSWNGFRVTSMVSFRIPEEFIKGIFDDFQNPARVTAIKALIQQSNNRKKKEAEEAKAAAALNKTSIMDITFISSDGSSSATVASVMTSQLETPLSESCATTYDSQLRQRKVQSTLSTIPSH